MTIKHNSHPYPFDLEKTLEPINSRYGNEKVIAMEAANKVRQEIQELKYQATHDELTGLLNRQGLNIVMRNLEAEARRTNTKIGVIAIDLDKFKQVNDHYGHARGDSTLVDMAKLFSGVLREGDELGYVARQGGDEFLILLPLSEGRRPTESKDLTPEQRVSAVVARLGQAADIYAGEDKDLIGLNFGASVGSEIFDPSKHRLLEDVLPAADDAVYQDKYARRAERI